MNDVLGLFVQVLVCVGHIFINIADLLPHILIIIVARHRMNPLLVHILVIVVPIRLCLFDWL